MRRSLFNLVTLLSLLLCALAVALWVRSGSGTDTFMIRTAASYLHWPNLKWIVIRTYDGWVVSLHQKIVPQVETRPVPWREDVPLSFKRFQPPNGPLFQKLTDADGAAFEADAAGAYRAAPLLRWQTDPRGPLPPGPPPLLAMPTVWSELGFKSYPDNSYLINDQHYPGAYHDVRVGIPHATVVGMAALLPAIWAGLWVRRYLAARRVGLCPACGYDLRQTTERCPECGRAVTEQEARRAGWIKDEGAGKPPPNKRPGRLLPTLRRRWDVVTFAVIVLAVALALYRGSGDAALAPDAEVRALRMELDAKFAELEREIARLREAGDVDGAARLEAELRRLQDPAAGRALVQSDAAELSVVGIYEGALPQGATRAPQTHPVGSASVEVRPSGRPVVLVLCSYEPVTWDLRVAPGARLQKVLLGGYYDQQVVGVPEGVPVEKQTWAGKSQQYFHAYHRGADSYWRMARTVQTLTGLPIASFHGRYGYRGKPFVVGPGDFEWEAQRTLAALEPLLQAAASSEVERALREAGAVRFDALWWSPGRRNPFNLFDSLATFDLAGPLKDTIRPVRGHIQQIAVDPVGPTYYGTDGHSLVRLDLTSGQTVPMSVNGTPRGLSWCTGAAFDTQRRRLMVAATSGGAGTLYIYTPDTGQWSAGVSTGRPLALAAPCYSPEEDCFYAIGVAPGDETQAIVRLSPEGVPDWRIPLTEPIPDLRLPGIRSAVQLLAVGRRLVMITAHPEMDAPGWAAPPQLTLIDPKANRVIYKGPLTPHAAAGTAATAQPRMANDQAPDAKPR